MIFNVQSAILSTTVPAQLEQTAESYDAAAERLRGVLARLPDYLAQLDRAEEVNWDSMSSDAYRSVLGLLRLPAEVMIVEVSVLASDANAIAADLRYYARQARTLVSILSAGAAGIESGADELSGRLDGLWNEARDALDGHASRFREYLDRHGGIPTFLHEDLRRSLLPA